MRPSSADDGVVRFGPFEADLRAGELRQDGRRVKLEGKPFQVLTVLLRRPGELVTREDLRDELWSADTFVEFDHSLNTAVNKVRAALGDSAREPRFIETLHRRGYRFVGKIKFEEALALLLEPDSIRPAAPRTFPPPQPRLGDRSAIVIAAVSAVLGITFGIQWSEWTKEPVAFGDNVASAVQPVPAPPVPTQALPPLQRGQDQPTSPRVEQPAVASVQQAARKATLQQRKEPRPESPAKDDPPSARASDPEPVHVEQIKAGMGAIWGGSRLQQLTWVDRAGRRLDSVGEMLSSIMYPSLSPDERFVAVTVGSTVWVQDIQEGTKTRISSGMARNVLPLWSYLDDLVLYSAQTSGNRNLYLQAPDGSGEAGRLEANGGSAVAFDWSRDGQYIVYRQEGPKTKADIGYLKRSGDGSEYEQVSFLRTRHAEGEPKLSPDSRFIAYCSDESGRREVYVTTFPELGPKFKLSTKGGTQPRWSRDGREIFYVDRDVLMVVPLTSADGVLSLGQAQRLFRHEGLWSPWPSQQYDVSADGKRFLVAERVRQLRADASIPFLRLETGWLADALSKAVRTAGS